MSLPAPLRESLTQHLGAAPQHVTRVSGGMVNMAARVQAGTQTVFVKWRAHAPPDFFACEADGLTRLHRAGAFRVPEVLGRQETQTTEDGQENPGFLLLEYLPPSPAPDPEAFAERVGERLAALHWENPAESGQYGLERDNYLGSVAQVNTTAETWWTFYRDCRLLPLIALAKTHGTLPPHREQGLLRLLERLERWLGDFPSRPVLLHGDLWSGNLLGMGATPVLVDPAVYYGEREVEIAYMELFTGFSERTFAAYRAAYPLDPGYEERRLVHQLYPLLAHLIHFGEKYGADVDAVWQHYL
jgi:fructosamine-3-kinase